MILTSAAVKWSTQLNFWCDGHHRQAVLWRTVRCITVPSEPHHSKAVTTSTVMPVTPGG
jgi:hypothetical protein